MDVDDQPEMSAEEKERQSYILGKADGDAGDGAVSETAEASEAEGAKDEPGDAGKDEAAGQDQDGADPEAGEAADNAPVADDQDGNGRSWLKDEEAAGEDEPVPGDLPEGIKKRLAREKAKREQAERERDAALDRIAAAEADKADRVATRAKEELDALDPDDFETQDEYLARRQELTAQIKPAKKAPEPKTEAKPSKEPDTLAGLPAAEFKALVTTAMDKVAATDPQLAFQVSRLPSVTEEMALVVANHDDPVQAARVLADPNNAEDVKRVAALPRHRQAYALTRMIVEGSAAKVPPARKQSKAPQPIDRSGGATEGRGGEGFSDFERRRNEEEARRGFG